MKKKILFFQTAFLGDLLLSIPCLKKIRELYPDYELHLYCRKPFAELFTETKIVDKAFEVDKKSSSSRKESFGKLKQQKYQMIFTPHPSFRSASMTARLNPSESYGFKSFWGSIFYKKTISKDLRFPDALRQLQLISLVDKELKSKLLFQASRFYNTASRTDVLDKDGLKIPDWASLNIKSEVVEWGKTKEPSDYTDFVLLAPGSVWATKRWLKEHFIDLGKKYSDSKVAIIGSPAEKELCEEVSKGIPEAINLAGMKLIESLHIMSQARLLIANDSGSIHMAASVDLPVVSVFGPTVPEQGFRPWVQPMAVVQSDLSCRPCGKHGGNKCPIGTHDCMKSVSVEQVYKATQKVLE